MTADTDAPSRHRPATLLAPSTRKGLDREWALFADWCVSWNLDPFEADANVAARFLAAFPAALSTSALRVRAIRQKYQQLGVPLALPGISRNLPCCGGRTPRSCP